MKKTTLILLSWGVAVATFAGKVTEQRAYEKAKQFMGSKKLMTRSKARAFGNDTQDNAFYVFNAENNDGFVIVSGDDRTEAILGYSDHGHIDMDHLPDNLRYWLASYAEQISGLGVNYHPVVKSKTRSGKANIEPLIKTNWDQWSPYWMMCPKDNQGNNTLTGCVPTAISQIMYYYQWPKSSPSIPAFTTGTQGIQVPELPATTFKWDKMKLTYTDWDDVSESAYAVAEVMRYVGQAFQADYGGCDGTGAFPRADALIDLFKYSKRQTYVFRFYSDTEWDNMVYNELVNQRPVYYEGSPQKEGSGHAYICDGYQDGYFHINWGWGGSNDGYFLLSVGSPKELDNYDVLGGYYGFSAYIHLVPAGQEPETTLQGIHYWVDKNSGEAFALQDDSYQELTSVMIPATVNYDGGTYEVKEIQGGAFANCGKINSVSISKNVERIGNAAFKGCGQLNSIKVDKVNPKFDSRNNCNALINSETNTLIRGCSSTIIPDGITTIGTYAFDGCAEKASITIPTSMTTIGYFAFSNFTGLESISIPNSVVSIGEKSFYGCSSLISLDLPKGLQSIDEYAFVHCSSLQSISIPETITSIGWGILENCEKLKTIFIKRKEPLPLSDGFGGLGCSKDVVLIVPDGCKEKYASADYWKEFEVILEQSEYEGLCNKIVSFSDPKVKEIVMTEKAWDVNGDGELSESELALVTDLGTLFEDTEIVSFDELRYFTGLTSLSDFAFLGCDKLSSITLPKNMKSIGTYSFGNCISLKALTIPKNVTSFGNNIFSGCDNMHILKMEANKPFGITERLFDFSEKHDVFLVVPNGSKSQYASADFWKEFCFIFEASEYEEIAASPIIDFEDPLIKARFVDFHDNNDACWSWDVNGDGELSEAEAALVTEFVPLYQSKITSFHEFRYFTGLTSLPGGAFMNYSQLSSITLPNSLTTIGDYAFYGCGSLETITIPEHVTSLGDYVFSSCDNLKSLRVEAKEPCPISAYFCENRQNILLVVPDGCKELYAAADYWKDFYLGAEESEIEESDDSPIITFSDPKVKAIIMQEKSMWDINGDGELSEAEVAKVTDVEWIFSESDITSFDEFSYFTGITSITPGAFIDCKKLESITLPESLTTIGEFAFYGCSSLRYLVIPENVSTLGEYICDQCDNLKGIVVWSKTPIEIADEIFSNRSDLILYVPKGCKETYASADYWKEFKQIVETVSSVSVTFGDKPITTYTTSYNMDFSGTDEIKAYVATGYDYDSGTVWLTRVKDVPAGMPVMIMGTPKETYDIPVKLTSGTYFKNMFVANTTGGTMTLPQTSGEMTNYYLSNGMFKTSTGSNPIAAGKCYLQIPTVAPTPSVGDSRSVTLNGNGLGSFSATQDLDFTDVEGLKAYAATGYDDATGTIWLTRVKRVSAGTGLLLMGAASGKYTIPSTSVKSYYANMMVGNPSGPALTIYTTSGDMTNYYLKGNKLLKADGTTGNTINPGKAYMQIPTAHVTRSIGDDPTENLSVYDLLEQPEVISMQVMTRGIDGDGDTTGIREAVQPEQDSDVYYNLNGQRVENPTKGLYIHNGRKVVIK